MLKNRWIRGALVTAVLAVQIPLTLAELPRLGFYRYGREIARGIKGAYR